MRTPDFTDENTARLAEIFPHCVTETRDDKGGLKRAIDFDQLRQELSGSIVEGPQERYHLDWPGKREALLTANAPVAKTLRPGRDESVDFDTTKNLFIEGDNLDALKLLQETYLGKIKMIYIDPPYNTGNDFIYDDDFAEDKDSYFERSLQKDEKGNRLIANPESNGRFHSDWLSMMHPRLKLARNLLRDDGLIFISIDDGEAHNLRKICDEVFGEDNFIAAMVLITGANQSGEGVKIQSNTESCVVYSRSISDVKIHRIDKVDESLRNLNDAPSPLETRTEMGYSIYYHKETGDFVPVMDYLKENIHLNREEDVYIDDAELIRQGYVPIRPGFKNRKLHRWRWGIDTFKERKGEVVIQESNGNLAVFFQQSGYNAPRNILNYGSGTAELKELFDGVKLFDFPKSYKYIQRLVAIGSAGDDIVLDFFSGSGTTAHAVMIQNAENGGNRRFIMVQLPEETDEKSEAFKHGYKTIAEIGKERIRRAGKKIKDAAAPGGAELDTGFRVMKIDTSNMSEVYYNPGDVTQDLLSGQVQNIREGRSPEDLLFQVLIDWGIDLSLPVKMESIQNKTVFFVDGNTLAACFDTGINEDFVKEIARCRPLRVVFRDSGFTGDAVKINVEQIFKLLSPATEVRSI
jgi:adenine-specific DNA-methyltransferase